ncbi:IclR family transcriptional regulator [Microbacterium fluvii]|uniref:IclR family transcriptional regulator n=1 Tax=Microbacterium fluvii TaxID=415215 RepID=A0ABW2HDY6_9MICO|nr:IclR family transcriptional regulator [Microbacterium fluvii]MCU4673091.1 IclR family transcriptional regulator [Microbacterium fluvii]
MSSSPGTTPAPTSEPGSVLGRILSLLDAVEASGGVISVTELATRTGMPKSTVSRLVAGLVEQRYLGRAEGGVALGLRLFEYGARASFPRRLRAAAAPIMAQLRETTGERVGLWVHHGTEMVSLAAVAGRLPMLPTRAGMRSPALTTASGKAYLAFCADPAVVERVSAPLVRDAARRFRGELDSVRASAVATDHGVAFPGIAAVASPVLSADRIVLGALSLAGPSDGMDAQRVAPLVRAASVQLARRLAAA